MIVGRLDRFKSSNEADTDILQHSPLLCCTGQTVQMWCCSPLRSKPTKPEDTTPYQSPLNLNQTVRSCYSGSICVTGNMCNPDIDMLHLCDGLRGRDWNKAHHCLSSEAKVSLGTRQGRSISQFSLSLALPFFLSTLIVFLTRRHVSPRLWFSFTHIVT